MASEKALRRRKVLATIFIPYRFSSEGSKPIYQQPKKGEMMKYEPEAWKKAYQENGFIVVHDLLDPTTLSRARDELTRIIENLERLPPSLIDKVFFERDHVKNNPQWYAGALNPEECGRAVRQIGDLALFDASFAELIRYQPMLDVLETIFESSEFSFNYLIGRPKAARVGNGISNGHFHRDTPFEEFTSANTVVVIMCLNDMIAENGATEFIKGSHQVSDEEAKKACWRDVEADKLNLKDRVTICCSAGAGVFFSTKTLHAAGHNRSDYPRHAIFAEWVGPGVLPTSPVRHVYQGLRPRSKDEAYQMQVKMSFAAPGASH
jgi:ectoine hydroxylase-related dioxygenase (phytanoyl-CoA dioxygenase family)